MARYEKTIHDEYSDEYYTAKSNDPYLLEQKLLRKKEIWAKKQRRQEDIDHKETQLELALEKTEEATCLIEEVNNILNHTLSIDDKIDWNKLYKNKKFKSFNFNKKEPIENDFNGIIPTISTFEHYFSSIFPFLFKNLKLERERKTKEASDNFKNALINYNDEFKTAKDKHSHEENIFNNEQEKYNNQIKSLKNSFENNEPEAIEKYIEMVLENSEYPDFLNLSSDVLFDPNKKTVIIDMELPNPEQFPKEIEFKYNKSKDEITSKEMKKKDFEQYYDNAIAQIAIRTIHEIFESVYTDCTDFVVFNGWVNGVDSKTGNDFKNCIVSIQAEKKQFESLNLSKVSPLDCIKGLKGLIASDFINLAPVKPIMQLNRNDKRIISSDAVIDDIDSSTNLASMDWQKFEVLIRDLFAKEFSGDGVEVHVTQASRDAGVDAIIFDPDPIKGGKFVIQAKRYNNVVGVSAVRDLYGTLMNEGAVKGILVTTSNFGKDSIEFAKDKPITLINGQELIYLFNKHGVNASIQTRKKVA